VRAAAWTHPFEKVESTPRNPLDRKSVAGILHAAEPRLGEPGSEGGLAQARALVHLRPELKLEDTLATLRRRSLAFVPVEPRFDPDIADLLTLTLQRSGLQSKHWDVERLNQYHPPPPSEWLPADQAPAPDVPDAPEAIRLYEHEYAEQLAVLLHTEVPSVMHGSSESLGAYLGMVMVHRLGGRWVPRRHLEEAAVIVGDKAWLPFLRARHHVQSRQAALDFSLTQLFRHARRSLS
jgi:hypothetical protein